MSFCSYLTIEIVALFWTYVNNLSAFTLKECLLDYASEETCFKGEEKHRRKEAIQKGTSVMLELLDQILCHVRDFKYVLFDSWFSWPDVISGIKSRQLDVICILKDMPRINYTYDDKSYRLSELHKVVDKVEKKTYISSVIVDYYGLPVRIVFVRNRNDSKNREWLALLSTDIEITEEEIIRIYGLRWSKIPISAFCSLNETAPRWI